LFCRIIKPLDHPAAHFRCRGQILAALAGGIQPGDRLIQVDSDPAHQPGGAHQLNQRIP
jgi:hypothetical protein